MRKISMSFVVTLTVSFTVRQKKIVNSTSIESHRKKFYTDSAKFYNFGFSCIFESRDALIRECKLSCSILPCWQSH